VILSENHSTFIYPWLQPTRYVVPSLE